MAHKGRHAWVEGARGKPQGKRSGGGDTEQTAAPPHVRRTVASLHTASPKELVHNEAAAKRSPPGRTHAAQMSRASPTAPPLRPPALPAKGGGHEHRWRLRRTCAARPPGPAAKAEGMQLAGETGHWWVSPTSPPHAIGGRTSASQRNRMQSRMFLLNMAPALEHEHPGTLRR